ncbi:flagellar biosynthetic protein FliO [Novispirillum itersonii]|uniref:flagellar biosynthetic protein FliO n=1 Tax=Novispirillum itersonii TaxID=189 RepID=UPI000379A459|nr:flagellar biosynthetic protein FliO [Novispirillum itersonii]
MEVDTYLRLFLSLALVLGLIFGTAALLRKVGGRLMTARGPRGVAPRLSVQEVMQIDPRRKLLLIRQDDQEHLLLLGGTQDLVISSGRPVARFTLPPEEDSPPPVRMADAPPPSTPSATGATV